MSKELQNIFESITPDNIKDVPVIQEAMKIFIETLEELSSESVDIANIYNNEKIREEIVKIYLDDLYNVFQSIQLNKKIIDKIDKTNAIYGANYYKKDAILNLVDSINDEHLFTIRSFKEGKGTKAAIKYIYDLISVFTLSERTEDFEFNEIDTFSFEVAGSLPEEFYEYIVRPLAHPLGFAYTYSQALKLVLEDYFPKEEFRYTINTLEVRCLQEDGSTVTIDFQYDETGKERVVVDIKTIIEDRERIRLIYFDDGTYLKQITDAVGQTYVYYMDENDQVIQTFEGQCSIYFDYDANFVTALEEECEFTIDTVPFDNFGRLDPNNDPNTGNLVDADIGFNNLKDQDGNISTTSVGRWENFYAPSAEADLKHLAGKFVYNYDVFENGVYIGTQPIKYTDTVIPEQVLVSRTLTEEQYNKQNEFNADYVAKEHSFEDIVTDISWTRSDDTQDSELGYLAIEPIYSNTPLYIGGTHPNSLVPLTIGTFTIGVENIPLLPQNNPIDVNPNLSGQQSYVLTEHEPVNFQYNTYDYSQFLLEYLDTESFGEINTQLVFTQEDSLEAENFDQPTDNVDTTIAPQQEANTYQEANYTAQYALINIGQSNTTLGDGHTIQYFRLDTTVYGDVYMEFDKMNVFVDENAQNFDFGVFRDGVRLEDNNVSALA